jgi:hypothetical protein
MVDFLVLTSSDQLVLALKKLNNFVNQPEDCSLCLLCLYLLYSLRISKGKLTHFCRTGSIFTALNFFRNL